MIVLRHALLLLAIFGFAAPAAAGLRMNSGQKIDFVRDLPNEAPFEYDGQYYDLGYLYSTSGRSRGSGFVLYHDDAYVQLDASGLSDVREALGEDPTEGYVPPSGGTPRTFADTGRSSSDSPYPASSASRAPSRPGSTGTAGGVVYAFLIFLAVLGGFARFVMRSAFGFGYSPWRRRPVIEADYADPFASRVNARMAELDNERARTGGYDSPPGGFGRRGV